MKWRPGDTSSWIYLFFFFKTLVLNKCHDIKIEVLPCSCSKHYQKRIGFHKSIVRPPEVSCKIHVDEFVADNFLALRKRAKINCFVTTIINYMEENVGRDEQKVWKNKSIVLTTQQVPMFFISGKFSIDIYLDDDIMICSNTQFTITGAVGRKARFIS